MPSAGKLRPVSRFFLGLLMLFPAAVLVFAAMRFAVAVFRPVPPFMPARAISALAGFVIALFVFGAGYAPMWLYVLGHEATHAVFALATGSKVGKMHIGRNGGYCTISSPGVLSTLSPYFFPFWLFVAATLKLAISFFRPQTPYGAIWSFVFSAAYCHHLFFTLKSLIGNKQPDMRIYGRFFSFSLVLLMNSLFLSAALWILSGAAFFEYFVVLRECAAMAMALCAHFFSWITRLAR